MVYDRTKMCKPLAEGFLCIFGCLALPPALLRFGNGFFAGSESVECKIEVVAYDLSSFPGITSQYLCRDLNRVTGCVASVAVAPTGILKEFQRWMFVTVPWATGSSRSVEPQSVSLGDIPCRYSGIPDSIKCCRGQSPSLCLGRIGLLSISDRKLSRASLSSGNPAPLHGVEV